MKSDETEKSEKPKSQKLLIFSGSHLEQSGTLTGFHEKNDSFSSYFDFQSSDITNIEYIDLRILNKAIFTLPKQQHVFGQF